MNSTSFTSYQRLALKGMDNQSLINLIRQAAANFPDTTLIITPRIDQSGQPYYWTGLRYCNTELDFALLLNREIEAFILCFLIKGRNGMTDISNYSPDRQGESTGSSPTCTDTSNTHSRHRTSSDTATAGHSRTRN